MWAKNIDIEYNSMNGDKNEFLYKKFLELDKVLIEQKIIIKKSFIWLPNEIIKEIDDCIIFLTKEYKRIELEMDKSDPIHAGHVFQVYFVSYTKKFLEMENKIICIIKNSNYYSMK